MLPECFGCVRASGCESRVVSRFQPCDQLSSTLTLGSLLCDISTMSLQSIHFIFVILGICGYVSADIPSEAPSIQDIGQKLASNLPEGLPPLPVNSSQIPTEEEARELLKDKCERLGGPGSYAKVESSQEDFKSCVMSLVNVTELQVEMEAAKPTGDLDVVFRKYCRKSPIFSQCISNFTSTIEPCLEEPEKESKQIVQNITEALLGFLCFKEGDRIALFIAEGGPECIQSKQDKIQNCANTTISKYMPTQEGAGGPLTHIPLLVLKQKECHSLNQFQGCVVSALEECSEPTPANIVESLFQFIMKMTPCQNMKPRSEQSVRSGAGSIWNLSILYLTTSTLALMSRLVTV